MSVSDEERVGDRLPRMGSTADIRGVELAFDRAGTGPSLVWGHGLTSSRQREDEVRLIDWDVVRTAADVVRYDARGHGGSALAGDLDAYGWDQLAADQLALWDLLGIERAVCGGASMGAATALHCAVMAPERVAALVLVIPPTAWETRAGQIDLYRQMADVVERDGVEPLIVAGAEMPPPDPFAGSPTDVEAWNQRRADGLRSADPSRLARVFRGAATADFPGEQAVAAIACPTLVLAWTGDPGHPVSTVERLDGLIADTTISIASTSDELASWTDRLVAFLGAAG